MPTTVVLILDRVTAPGRLRIAFAGLMCALAAWTALSATWSPSAAGSIREVERTLVYVAVALAIAFLVRRGDEPAIVAGAFTGIALVSGYALATRLFPDRFHAYDDPTLPYRLSTPLGYWNALGLLAVLGVLLALSLAAHARRRAGMAPAAALLPVLASTTYFTFSRGAWGALVLGVMVMVALDPRRIRLLWVAVVVFPASAVCVAIASEKSALTTEHSPAPLALQQGHRQAYVTGILAVASALLALAARAAAGRIGVSPRIRRLVGLVLLAAGCVIVVGALVWIGGPVHGLSTLRAKFDARSTATGDLNTRLFSISGNGRAETIHVAWEDGRRHVLAGNGAGSFEYVWYEKRPSRQIVRDAHSLYVEMFAELGLVGLGLLGGVLAMPLAGCVRARRSRFVPAGTAALVAWAAASSLDWHWEVAGLTMTALLVGSVGLLAAQRGRRRLLVQPVRLAGAGVGAALSVFAVVSLVGNQALFAGKEALTRKEWTRAHDDAERARTLLPWSFEPDLVLGDAEAGLGRRDGAVQAYRDAVAIDPRNWVAWLRLAQVAEGTERRKAYAQAHSLNPREKGLPGESSSG